MAHMIVIFYANRALFFKVYKLILRDLYTPITFASFVKDDLIRGNRKVEIDLRSPGLETLADPGCTSESNGAAVSAWCEPRGDLEIHGTSKDLIRETSRKAVSMNNRHATFLRFASSDFCRLRLFQSGGENHLLRIIIESRFIIPASMRAPRRLSSALLSDRSILQTVSPIESSYLSTNIRKFLKKQKSFY